MGLFGKFGIPNQLILIFNIFIVPLFYFRELGGGRGYGLLWNAFKAICFQLKYPFQSKRFVNVLSKLQRRVHFREFPEFAFSRKLSLCHFLLFILSGWGCTLVTQRDADEDQLINYEFHMNGETRIIAKFALQIFCQIKRGVHFFAKLPRLHCKSLIIQTPSKPFILPPL